MTLEDTIYVLCAAFPTVKQNRAWALGHLYCTTGNGYDWIGGQLIGTCNLWRNGKPIYKGIEAITASQMIALIFDDRRKEVVYKLDPEPWDFCVPDDISERLKRTDFNYWSWVYDR